MDLRSLRVGASVLVIGSMILGCAGGTGLPDPSPQVPEVEAPAPRTEAPGRVQPPRARGTGRADVPVPPATPELDPPDPAAAVPLPSGVQSVSRARFERSLQNVEGLADVADLRPNLTVRGMDGIRIHSMPATSPLHLVGLRAGDVVHRIDDHRFTSPAAALQAVSALQHADRLEGEITRDGVRQTLAIVLE